MKDLFFMGGPTFMAILSILLIISVAWFVYNFVIAYNSKQPNQEKFLRRLGYGKTIGLFALVTGCLGQLIGLTAMFDAIQAAFAMGNETKPELIFGAIKVTMIVTMYGILIYLLSLLLWFVTSVLIEKKLEKQVSV